MYKLVNEGNLYRTGSSLEEKVEDIKKDDLDGYLILGGFFSMFGAVGTIAASFGCALAGTYFEDESLIESARALFWTTQGLYFGGLASVAVGTHLQNKYCSAGCEE